MMAWEPGIDPELESSGSEQATWESEVRAIWARLGCCIQADNEIGGHHLGYAVTKGMFSKGKQSVAEACAKHLGDIVLNEQHKQFADSHGHSAPRNRAS
jgi:hypothetical protein